MSSNNDEKRDDMEDYRKRHREAFLQRQMEENQQKADEENERKLNQEVEDLKLAQRLEEEERELAQSAATERPPDATFTEALVETNEVFPFVPGSASYNPQGHRTYIDPGHHAEESEIIDVDNGAEDADYKMALRLQEQEYLADPSSAAHPAQPEE